MEESKVISGRYSKVVQDISVRNTFLITLCVGVIGIIMGIAIGSPFISIAVPIIVMAIYIGITSYSKSDLPMTIIGDSYYYQGFIFTLVALMASLFSLGVNEKVDMNAMVASFGAALITTIIGLTARLFINSFSISSQQRRERLEIEIERELTKFSGQLEILTTQVVSSVNNVHASTQSSMQTTMAEYEKMTKQMIVDQLDASERGQSAVITAMQGLAAKIEKVDVRPEVISQPIRESLTNVLSVMDETNKRYNSHLVKFDNNANKLAGQMDATGSQIETFLNGLSSKIAVSISDSNRQLSSEISTISARVMESLSAIESLKSKTNAAVDHQLGALSKSISDIVEQLNAVTSPVKEVSEKVVLGVGAIAKGLAELEANLGATTENVAVLKGASTDVNELVVSMKALNQEITAGINVNHHANATVAAASSATENSSKQLAKDIEAVYSELTKQIKRLRDVN